MNTTRNFCHSVIESWPRKCKFISCLFSVLFSCLFLYFYFSPMNLVVLTCTCDILSVSTALLPISSFVFHTFHGAINNWADAKVVSCSFSFFVFFFILFSLSLSSFLSFSRVCCCRRRCYCCAYPICFLLKNKTQILTGECPTRTSIYHAIPSERS